MVGEIVDDGEHAGRDLARSRTIASLYSAVNRRREGDVAEDS